MYRPQCHSRSVVASFFGASDRQADYYRYIAEFRSGDEKSKAAEEARKAYAEAAKVASEAPWEYHGEKYRDRHGF